MSGRVDEALLAVSRSAYVRQPDGSQLPQSSALHIVKRVLELLDPRAGDRILELGTGSGFSTALLPQVVGPAGRIVTVDVDSEMTDRAIMLFVRHGLHNIEAVCADGRRGHRAGAPYDRIVAWASTGKRLPTAWLRQLVDDGVIVAPMRRPLEPQVVRFRVRRGRPVEEASIADSLIPLTAEPLRPWLQRAHERQPGARDE